MGPVRRLQNPIPGSNLWFPPATSNDVVSLATHCMSYDFVGNSGRTNIGEWIEQAALAAGR